MDWQTAISLLIVFFAATLLLRSVWPNSNAKKAGCGSGCGSCPANIHSQAKDGLVSLGPFPPAAPGHRSETGV